MSPSFDFEWDAKKSVQNVAQRGFGFEAVTSVFLDPDRVEIDVTRAEDGEPRGKVISTITAASGKLFTMRGDVIRIISARRANTTEIRAYDNR